MKVYAVYNLDNRIEELFFNEEDAKQYIKDEAQRIYDCLTDPEDFFVEDFCKWWSISPKNIR